ncbi:uncharacterized protein LOC129291995 [Prosopis cineraria]|uniref:uncharacterized protein LOC129291995 n=1 Tax=Prosopis cineraria TaxID=364024 RepID=UPI00240FD2A1|nr:uncharacterized protein LOC129291995 [Prosopis cineraria]
MNPIVFLLLLSLFTPVLEVEPAKPRLPGKPRLPSSHITVMGFVYCDTCSNNSFSRHSYFLSGVEVKIDCMFKARSAKTKEQITVSVNRTTDKHGMYKLEIPSVDGVKCAEDPDVASSCQVNLMGSSSSSCDVPSYRSTSNEITVKARRDNLCIYSLTPLSYRPSKKDIALCGN